MKKFLLFLSLPFLLAACAGNSNVSSRDILLNVEEGNVLSEKFGLMWQQDKSRFYSTAVKEQECNFQGRPRESLRRMAAIISVSVELRQAET